MDFFSFKDILLGIIFEKKENNNKYELFKIWCFVSYLLTVKTFSEG